MSTQIKLLSGRAKGQVILEYGILISLILIAVMVSRVYLKRSIQGNLKSGIDSIGDQYDPEKTTSNFTYHSETNTTTSVRTEPKEVTLESCGPFGCGTLTYNASVITTTTDVHYSNSTSVGNEIVEAP